jgi:streptogramin lyase
MNGSAAGAGGDTSGAGVTTSGSGGVNSGAAAAGSGVMTGTSGSSAGGASGGVAIGTTGSAASSGGVVPVMSAPVTAVKGPDVTFTEFPVPTPSSPGAICAGPDGRIWFLHQSTAPSAVGAVTIDGATFSLYRVNITNLGPTAIAPGPDGNVWYTKQQGIGKAMPSGTFAEYGAPGGMETGGIVKGPDGNMWYTEPVAERIAKSTMAGVSTDFPLPGTMRTPFDITVGPDGNLWFTETTANKIGRITPAGMVTEYSIPTPASFPKAITLGPDGNLWFVEHDAHNIARVTPTGTFAEFGIPSGGRPYAMALGPDGNLWFSEPGSTNAIGRCTPTGGISEYPIPTPNTEVAGITAGPDKNIWFAEKGVNKIGRLSNLMGGGNVPSAMGPLSTPLTPAVMCTKDTDCVYSGKACGGDVCSYKATPHVCVLANSGDPGWCTAAADCWCAGAGATCDATTHHCSRTE